VSISQTNLNIYLACEEKTASRFLGSLYYVPDN